MQTTPEKTCEQFYFERIAPVEATVEDYREFFELLWKAHGEIIFKFACARLANHEDARDVCQDTFVHAMRYLQRNPDRVPLQVNFRAWLRVIARHLIVDRFRKVMVRPEEVASAIVEDAPVEQPPEARAIADEDLAILRKCLEELTERARTIVLLREAEGMSGKDVAARLNSSPNAVCVALHRALKALRECVAMGQVG